MRQQAAARVNARFNCRAAVTAKRSLENYLHPAAIAAAGGPVACFGDTDNVGLIVAEAHHRQHYPTPWESLPRRQRRALVHKAKRWLCTVVVNRMTAELVVEADPAGEIVYWLNSIRELMA